MCLVDQLPCGSVLTPAISCTKLKIHSAHADSPMAKTLFSIILGWTTICFTDQETQEENMLGGPTPLWVSTYTSYLLYKVQDPFSTCRQSWPKHFFSPILGWTSLCFTDLDTQKENVLAGPTPLWVSTYTSYLLYKVQDPLSGYRQSYGQNSFFLYDFRKDQSLLPRPRNSGRECAWWTNSLVGQYLHQLSLVQSSRFIQHMQTVLWPKQFFLLLQF